MTSRKLAQMFLVLAILALPAVAALAGEPGLVIADAPIVSDQKAGSVLVFNLYASSSTNPSAENTRINLTNTNSTEGTIVHLFFIDGRTCSVADSFVCLSKSQTTSILASDVDPDVMGYLIAVAVNDAGLPIKFNYLIGDEYIRLISGHAANLAAEAISALDPPTQATPEMTVALSFDGVAYNYLPRALAIDSIPSAKDGNETLLVINRIGGSLVSGAATIGSVFGIMYDQQEAGYSFSFSPGTCQYRATLSDSFPRTTPRFTNVIPAGSTGWAKFWGTTDKALLGAVINKAVTLSAATFGGGHNLHKLTWTKAGSFEIPVFTATCN
ncbi:MAG TPA: hypothetical protein VNQ79_22995 [Blastocatellia bacterium]|nr:hypothetical protein [Blastocatellia bacterium]